MFCTINNLSSYETIIAVYQIVLYNTQAKNEDGARSSIKEVLEYLISVHDIKEAIKADGKTIKLRFADGR